MNKFILIISAILFASCKNETNTNGANAAKKELSGKELFEGKGNCIACHQPEQKIIGPSIQEIATIYKDKKETKCCKTAKECACMLAFSCGISTVFVTILNM